MEQGAATLEYKRLRRLTNYKTYLFSLTAGESKEVDVDTDLGESAVVLLVRNKSSQVCYLKINAITNDRISLLANDSLSFNRDEIEVSKMYLVNDDSGATTCSLEILCIG